jgi:hypothetical protein
MGSGYRHTAEELDDGHQSGKESRWEGGWQGEEGEVLIHSGVDVGPGEPLATIFVLSWTRCLAPVSTRSACVRTMDAVSQRAEGKGSGRTNSLGQYNGRIDFSSFVIRVSKLSFDRQSPIGLLKVR